MTYSQLRELLKNKLEELGYPSTEFGVHSLRAGGTTAAVERCISDRLFNKHVYCRLETGEDNYVEDILEQHVLVMEETGH